MTTTILKQHACNASENCTCGNLIDDSPSAMIRENGWEVDLCDCCGEEQWVVLCVACGQRETWCQSCQDSDYFDPNHELCSDCFAEFAQSETSARAEYAANVPIEVKRLELPTIDEDEIDEEDFDYDDTESPYLRSLRRVAIFNAYLQRESYLVRAEQREEFVDWKRPYRPDSDRAIVSFLRHNASNYDELLDGLGRYERFGIGFEDNDYLTIKNRVHAALAEVYPEVAGLFE